MQHLGGPARIQRSSVPQISGTSIGYSQICKTYRWACKGIRGTSRKSLIKGANQSDLFIKALSIYVRLPANRRRKCDMHARVPRETMQKTQKFSGALAGIVETPDSNGTWGVRFSHDENVYAGLRMNDATEWSAVFGQLRLK